MTIAALTGSQPWQVAGWTMLHFLWVGGAIGLVSAALRRSLRGARPEVRYSAALSGLAALAVAPVAIASLLFAAALPGIPRGTPSAPKAVPLDLPRAVLPDTDPEPSMSPGPLPVAGRSEDLVTSSDQARSGQFLTAMATGLPGLWLVGAPGTFALLATGLIGAEWLRRQSRPITEGDLPERCRRLAGALGLVRPIALGVCDRLVTPVLLGVVRPMILLPASALTGWGLEQIEMALLHELAHVRRHDNLVNLVQRTIESVLFFHPAVWWASGGVRLEREHCCDRLVVSHTGRARPYAELLAALAMPGASPGQAALAMAEAPVVARIRRILEPEASPMKLSGTAVVAAAFLTILPTLLIGAYVPMLGGKDDPVPRQVAAVSKLQGEPDDPDRDDSIALKRALELVARSAKPDDVQALRSLARVQFEAGDRDAGRETLRRAIDVAEKTPKPDSRVYGLLFVAMSQAALGDKEGARETLRRALAAAPKVTDLVEKVATLAFAAQIQVQAGDRQGGDETIARAIALQQSLPDRDPNGDNLNVRLTAQHRVVAALVEIGELDRALELAANDPDSINISLRHVAHGLPKLKDRDHARAILRRALEISAQSRFPGTRGQALATVAGAQAELGDFDEAVATARRIAEGPDAELNENYLSSALREIAKAEAAAGRREGAQTLLLEAFAIADRQRGVMRASLLQFVAEAQAEADDLAGASRTIASIGENYPSDQSQALVALAAAQAKTGARDDARATLQKAGAAADRIGPRVDIGNFNPAWMRSYAYHRIAIVQAKLGDYEGALATLRDRTGDEFSERANGLNDVVDLQIATGDLKGALKTALALKIDDFRAGVSAEAVARAQARAGNPAEVLAWGESLDSTYVKARALVGMIRGLAEKRVARKPSIPAPQP